MGSFMNFLYLAFTSRSVFYPELIFGMVIFLYNVKYKPWFHFFLAGPEPDVYKISFPSELYWYFCQKSFEYVESICWVLCILFFAHLSSTSLLFLYLFAPDPAVHLHLCSTSCNLFTTSRIICKKYLKGFLHFALIYSSKAWLDLS